MTENAGMTAARNWFDTGGSAYALFRPEYPAGLARFLAQTVDGRGCASTQSRKSRTASVPRALVCAPGKPRISIEKT